MHGVFGASMCCRNKHVQNTHKTTNALYKHKQPCVLRRYPQLITTKRQLDLGRRHGMNITVTRVRVHASTLPSERDRRHRPRWIETTSSELTGGAPCAVRLHARLPESHLTTSWHVRLLLTPGFDCRHVAVKKNCLTNQPWQKELKIKVV